MPVFEFTGPDGQTYEVEGPEGATEQEAFGMLQQQLGGAGGYDAGRGVLSVNIGGKTPEEQQFETDLAADAPEGFVEQATAALGRGGRDVMNALGGAADLVTLPVTTIMNLLGANVRSYRDITNDAASAIGLPENETDDQRLMSAINEGGMLGLATAGAGGAVGALPGVAGAVGRTLAATPVADMAASAGGMAGQEVAEQSGGGPLAQLGAALVGGALGAGGVGAASRIPGLLPKNRQLNELGQAAERIGVDLLPAAAGGPITRGLSSGAAQMPVSARPIVKAADRMIRQAQEARDKVASAFGVISNPEAAGEAARQGALATIKNTGNIGRRLYDHAGEMAGDARIPLNNAKAVLDEQIARLEAVPGGGAGLADVRALRSQLDNPDGFTIQGVRDMRTEMFVAPELRGGPVEKRMKDVVAATSQDIEQGLRAQGKGDAADAFRAADDYWKERLDLIDRVIRPVIGKDGDAKGGEDIFKSIEAATRGNAEKLHRFLRALPEEEQGIVRASIIGRLGRATKSAQNDEGDAFSLETFLSNWNDLSPRSKNILFDGEYRKDMDALAKIASGTREGMKVASKSNTPLGIAFQTAITGGSTLAGLQMLGVSLAGQYGAGRMLASPGFARWLASAAKKPNETAFRQQVGRLSAVAAAEPTIANEVRALQDRLMQSFGNIPQRAAAEEGKND
jgi:hypothetical protein